ncbi:S-adenosyl-L-methionine-dependent methyltransferase [Lineolata rhizophorae]|uniref:Protein arginine methyltransferase NDUFAF7 n=1 Tax=Lineolata rhizophorae TaxID=578093 RepID=A0A6A6P7Y1_9PEZI|nr:S-adenosyl-L-methionine-dependent methyltransferase [Lineolata rhizophorae]
METPVIANLFRPHISRNACQWLHHRPFPCCGIRGMRPVPLQRRAAATGSRYKTRTNDETKDAETSAWKQRMNILSQSKQDECMRYPLITADELRTQRERPKGVRMLLRDFIEDSLYNPFYGYFSKQVVIFSPGEPFHFNTMRDEIEFHKTLGDRYTAFEDALDQKEYDETRQLWHTPTELFRPYYGQSIADYLISNYKISHYPYDDLIIYEMGAGNGTLMLNILDHIRAKDPEVYARTKFKIIEVSANLASLQRKNISRSIYAGGHRERVEIINRSIFDWDTYVPSPCFFLALEVFDNFAHDAISYDMSTHKPLQSMVFIDGEGEFYEYYTPKLDHLASRYLRLRRYISPPETLQFRMQRLWRSCKSLVPFTEKRTAPEYIPTRLMQFFDILYKHFPAHRLIASDFHTLPDAVSGINAPVVQTRYRRRTIPVTTPLVHQGYFDILFPTDFNMMAAFYEHITQKFPYVLSHEDFLRRWAYVEDTQARNGDNPLLTWYKNTSVMITR